MLQSSPKGIICGVCYGHRSDEWLLALFSSILAFKCFLCFWKKKEDGSRQGLENAQKLWKSAYNTITIPQI